MVCTWPSKYLLTTKTKIESRINSENGSGTVHSVCMHMCMQAQESKIIPEQNFRLRRSGSSQRIKWVILAAGGTFWLVSVEW